MMPSGAMILWMKLGKVPHNAFTIPIIYDSLLP